MFALLVIYRSLQDSTKIASVIIGKTIMYHLCINQNVEEHGQRKWVWTFGRNLFFCMLAFAFGTFLLSLPHHQSTLSDFGGWLNITAGTAVAVCKAAFVISHCAEIGESLNLVAALDAKMQLKGMKDEPIRKRRNWYFQFETCLAYSALVFTLLMEILIFGQDFVESPHSQFRLSTVPWGLDESGIGFGLSYAFVVLGGIWGSCLMVSMDLMVGNLFHQIILNVEVMIEEIRSLGRDSAVDKEEERRVEEGDKEEVLIGIAQEYQHLRECLKKLNDIFRPILLLVVISNMIVLTFISIELALVMHDDPARMVRPGMYFIFMSTAFFYWCWLGQKLSSVSEIISMAVYEFDWNCGGVPFKKLRLMVMQMTRRPLQILAAPFFELDFNLFFSVLRRAYSIMAVLKDVALANE